MNQELIIDTFLASSDKRATEILISVIFRPLPQGRGRLDLNDMVKRTRFFLRLISDEPERVALKFLSIIQSSVETPIIRKIFLIFLYSQFSSYVMCNPIPEMKPILFSLLEQERWMPAFTTLSRIISIYISRLFSGPRFNEDWVELLDYIDTLLVLEVKKGLWVIRDLPINMQGPLFKRIYRHMFLPVIFTHLQDTSTEDEDLWVLAFGATYTMALLMIGIGRSILIPGIRTEIMCAISKLFDSGKQVFVQNAFKSIHYIRNKEKENGSYMHPRIDFINDLAEWVYRLDGVTHETKHAVRIYTSSTYFYRF